MKEFAYGSDMQFCLLKQSLEDHRCHVYPGCRMPRGIHPASARIGFEKEENTYALFIDKGLNCSNRKASSMFNEWLRTGTLRFMDFTDMKEFLKSLRPLF